MPLLTASINSGSNGNCYFVGNGTEAVLVDVGLSCREVEKRMARLKLSITQVKAIFISHEHTDHISGVEVLSRKYQLPVYITPSTLKNTRLQLNEDLIRPFIAAQPVPVGGLAITAFKKFHDASEPHSFVVEGDGVKIGVFTDIGMCCDKVIHYFKQCHAVYLEANYEDEMLQNGPYPFYLKKRISGGKGHLSNAQALSLFKQHKPEFMNHVFLSHLSRDNNSPHLVKEMFEKSASGTQIVVASRYNETEVYTIADKAVKPVKNTSSSARQAQLSLF